jgi:hypothetical protein
MLKSLVPFLILVTGNAYAANQLSCHVSEDVNAPLAASSVKYDLQATLSAPRLNAVIGQDAQSLDLSFSIDTFLSELTSPGQQVILISITDKTSGATATLDGHGTATTFYDTKQGTLFVECSVQ